MNTIVNIVGPDFYLNGAPTYAGRTFEGKRVEGLLFNVRAVQATFDDEHPATRQLWAYPDTNRWDPQRNTDDFCAALPAWKAKGVLAFTVNFQGGGPLYSPPVYGQYQNNAYTLDGKLKPAYARRMTQVLETADSLGMVVIVGLFYWKQVEKMENAAMWQAARNGLAFLRLSGFRNFLIEIANENGQAYPHRELQQKDAHVIIDQLRAEFPEMLFSTSFPGMEAGTGCNMPTPALVAASDYVLLHGNECLPEGVAAGINFVRAMPAYQKCPKPIIINEDSPGIPNLNQAFAMGVSWGYYDQGYGGADAYGGDRYMDYRSKPRERQYSDLSGFQTPPVNWGINTEEKIAFFERVAEITGCA
ncbi:MAG: hypothetical protein HPY85_01670 [Anaerolineae bacterium]|nr:hypothetical protein [Anaerolineae bacterium]